jgi:hypothetical protein
LPGARDPWRGEVATLWAAAQAGNAAACQQSLAWLGGQWHDREAVRAEWEAGALERARIDEERILGGLELAMRQGYGPVTVPERASNGRVFTGPPPHVFGQLPG